MSLISNQLNKGVLKTLDFQAHQVSNKKLKLGPFLGESFILILQGQVNISLEKTQFAKVGSRKSVFQGAAEGVFLPAGVEAVVSTSRVSQIGRCAAPSSFLPDHEREHHRGDQAARHDPRPFRTSPGSGKAHGHDQRGEVENHLQPLERPLPSEEDVVEAGAQPGVEEDGQRDRRRQCERDEIQPT